MGRKESNQTNKQNKKSNKSSIKSIKPNQVSKRERKRKTLIFCFLQYLIWYALYTVSETHYRYSFEGIQPKIRTLVKSAERKFNFLISQPKHMLWVLKRTVSMRRFF